MTPYATNAATFLVSVAFGLYILALMLRFLFQWLRLDFYNPLSQALVRVTNPALRPLRRWIPGWQGIDAASLLLMLVLQATELGIVLSMQGMSPGLAGLLVLALAELARLAVYVFMWAIIIEVVLSWVAPGTYNPMTELLFGLTRPVLRPIRRLVPPLGGLDLSPLVAIVGLQLMQMLLVAPLRDLGRGLL